MIVCMEEESYHRDLTEISSDTFTLALGIYKINLSPGTTKSKIVGLEGDFSCIENFKLENPIF